MKKTITQTFLLTMLLLTMVSANPGDIIWTQVYNTGFEDWGYSVNQTTDGGFIIAGKSGTMVVPNCYNTFLMKTDSEGFTQWTKTFGEEDGYESAMSVKQTTDGGYILGGWTESYGPNDRDFYLIKTDASGDTIWTKVYGDSPLQQAHSVQQTEDGGYVLAGWILSTGYSRIDFYVVKTDSVGNAVWTYQNEDLLAEEAYSVQQTNDGAYVIAGYTQSSGEGQEDFYLIRLDSSGEVVWTQTYGGFSSDVANSVKQATDDGFLIAGTTYSFGEGNADFYLVKTDADGEEVWTHCYGGELYEEAYSVSQIHDGGYIIAGLVRELTMESCNIFLTRTDSLGNELWSSIYGGGDYDIAYSVEQLDDENYIVVGSTKSFGSMNDIYILKIKDDEQSDVVDPGGPLPIKYSLGENYPNPFNAQTTIEYKLPETTHARIEVYDILGRRISTLRNMEQPAGYYEVTWNSEDSPSGIYFYRLQTNIFRSTKKMLLLK